ncbi:hypothetical protein BKA62DRAFT_787636 [Auriculariales sp. MPI-PUGE-AT-0066]|nr:hypothetical protein BKA62DRAFT_787636 [Auriculariales sp. MPI-PUGE-AT-0066]
MSTNLDLTHSRSPSASSISHDVNSDQHNLAIAHQSPLPQVQPSTTRKVLGVLRYSRDRDPALVPQRSSSSIYGDENASIYGDEDAAPLQMVPDQAVDAYTSDPLDFAPRCNQSPTPNPTLPSVHDLPAAHRHASDYCTLASMQFGRPNQAAEGSRYDQGYESQPSLRLSGSYQTQFPSQRIDHSLMHDALPLHQGRRITVYCDLPKSEPVTPSLNTLLLDPSQEQLPAPVQIPPPLAPARSPSHASQLKDIHDMLRTVLAFQRDVNEQSKKVKEKVEQLVDGYERLHLRINAMDRAVMAIHRRIVPTQAQNPAPARAPAHAQASPPPHTQAPVLSSTPVLVKAPAPSAPVHAHAREPVPAPASAPAPAPAPAPAAPETARAQAPSPPLAREAISPAASNSLAPRPALAPSHVLRATVTIPQRRAETSSPVSSAVAGAPSRSRKRRADNSDNEEISAWASVRGMKRRRIQLEEEYDEDNEPDTTEIKLDAGPLHETSEDDDVPVAHLPAVPAPKQGHHVQPKASARVEPSTSEVVPVAGPASAPAQVPRVRAVKVKGATASRFSARIRNIPSGQ